VSADRYARSRRKNEAHLPWLSLPVSVAEHDAANVSVTQTVAICVKMPCDRKTRQVILDVAELLSEAFLDVRLVSPM